MISDRISLNLAYLYLNRVHQTVGPVSDILFSKRDKDSPTVKTPSRFSSLSSFYIYIQGEAPITTFKDINCMSLNLYQLKSFKYYDSSKDILYTVENKDGVFFTKGDMNLSVLDDLTVNYTASFSEVEKRFTELKRNEYILLQDNYIDCGYIEKYFQDDLENLKKLYKKYRETV